MDIKQILKTHAYQNVPLWYDQAYELGCYALDGCRGNELAMIQSVVALSALHSQATYSHIGDGVHTPKSAAEQIAGVCAAIFTHDIGTSEFGFIKPKVPFVMDNSGMGGDLVVTANVSTLASLIAATAGIPMCKHGSPANADGGRHGSSDFISLCGIDPFASRTDVERSVEKHSFAFTEALNKKIKLVHLQTHTFAKVPHMNDIIGPITNPIDPSLMTRRVIGINHLLRPQVVADAYQILNEKKVTRMDHLYVVRGYVDATRTRGVDELSLCGGGTDVAELIDGKIHCFNLEADTFGINPTPTESISPPAGMSKGAFSLGILHGEIGGPPLEMVLANAALLFKLADASLSYRRAYEAAADTYYAGNTPRTVERARLVAAHAA